MASDWVEHRLSTDGAEIFVRYGGSGPPLLLLHGFPETSLMWREIAPQLVDRFSVVAADLRGYGQSSCPASDPAHANGSKRAMAPGKGGGGGRHRVGAVLLLGGGGG